MQKVLVDVWLLSQIHDRYETAVLTARDMLRPIIEGEIERGHCSPGSRERYGAEPGKRKTTLADARKLVKHVIALIDRATTDFEAECNEATRGY